jgi:glycosyltransferase involved in cell wall biosynthesis
LAKFLQGTGVEVTLVAGRFDREMLESETIENVPIRRIEHNLSGRAAAFGFYCRCALWLYRKRHEYDVIHFREMPIYWYPIFVISKALKKPVFVTMTLYGSDDLESISRNRLGGLHLFFLRRVNKIFAISKKLLEASQHYVRDKTLITHLNYPIDIHLFRPANSSEERTILRTKFGVSTESRIVIFSGSVLHRKGIDLLIEAWPKVIDEVSNALLCIVGPRTFNGEFGFTNQEFSRQIDARIGVLGIRNSIMFMGDRVNDIPELLRMADVFVLPSREEGVPQALIEAMATGLPCLICEQPWVPEGLILHGRSGLICPPDPKFIADGIRNLLMDQNRSLGMGACARNYVEENHNPETLTARLVELYRASTWRDSNQAEKTVVQKVR